MKYCFKLYTNNAKWTLNHLIIIKKYVNLFNLFANYNIHLNNANFNIRLSWSSIKTTRINNTTVIRSPHIYKKSKESFSIISHHIVIFLSMNNCETFFNITNYHIYQVFVIHLFNFISNNNKIIMYKSTNKNFLF